MRGRRVLVAGRRDARRVHLGHAWRASRPRRRCRWSRSSAQSFHLGGAGNVAAQRARARRRGAVLAGVVGHDARGRALQRALPAAGVEAALAVADGGRPTTVKTRIIAHHQQVVRADREQSRRDPARPRGRADRAGRRARCRGCRALIVVSDYQKGVVTPRADEAAARARAAPQGAACWSTPRCGTSRCTAAWRSSRPTSSRPSRPPAMRIRTQADLHAAGRASCAPALRAVLITRGEQGMSLFERGRRPLHIPTAAREVFDVTGAGDTVIATLGAGAWPRARRSPRRPRSPTSRPAWWSARLGTATATPEERAGGAGGRGAREGRRSSGARPGGSAAGAARWRGTARRVTLFDASHPREKPCGGGLTGKALALLPRGVRPTTRCPRAASTAAGSSPATAEARSSCGSPAGRRSPSRRELDAWLLRRALGGRRACTSPSAWSRRPGRRAAHGRAAASSASTCSSAPTARAASCAARSSAHCPRSGWRWPRAGSRPATRR